MFYLQYKSILQVYGGAGSTGLTHLEGIEPPSTVLETVVLPLN